MKMLLPVESILFSSQLLSLFLLELNLSYFHMVLVLNIVVNHLYKFDNTIVLYD